MPRSEARSFIDALENDEFAALMRAMSEAGIATHGEAGGNLFYESSSARIEGLVKELSDLREQLSSQPPFPRMLSNQELINSQMRGPVAFASLRQLDLEKLKDRYLRLVIKDGHSTVESSDKPFDDNSAPGLAVALHHESKKSKSKRSRR